MRKLELLAPAKDLECGIAAIDHGADAVYIGAPSFGARAAAGNSVDDIRRLCAYAHPFGAKVYVTVNTIVYEGELDEARALLADLTGVGVDALIVQDMAVFDLLPKDAGRLPVLHASTQTDNRTIEKVAWLQGLGFERVVLARELSLADIDSIHKAVPSVELEAFVHGALCVAYSGLCYASQFCFGRSANRGECAHFCRMKFDLVDSRGTEIVHQRYLLSLKDMCRIDDLERLADSGVCSFKIEGRLKDVAYVKNVVSAYAERLDRIVERRKTDYYRASLGRVNYLFEPNLQKTFNRGYTDFFLHRRQPDIYSPNTPKALGEYVGKVKEVGRQSFSVAGTACFANGDGLCFVNGAGQLEGFRINRAEGNRLFPQKLPAGLQTGMALYRNNDEAFGKILGGKTAERKIALRLSLAPTPTGVALTVAGQGLETVRRELTVEKQPAQKPQRDNILRQLSKVGGTIYSVEHVELTGDVDRSFIPSSLLADLRRQAVEALRPASIPVARSIVSHATATRSLTWHPEYKRFPYLYNISNSVAKAFYQHRGLKNAAEAYEVDSASSDPSPMLVMQCKHCIRYSLGYCTKYGGQKPVWKEPLSLRLGDGRSFRLEFKCDECQMNIYTDR